MGVMKTRVVAVIVALLTTTGIVVPVVVTGQTLSLQRGPYLNGISFMVLPNAEMRSTALQTGQAHLDVSHLDPIFLETMQTNPEITVNNIFTTSYSALVINCNKYPLNLTAFRRAFAFAYNKTFVLENWCEGFSLYHDSIVPRANSLCAEDTFDWHYYEQDLTAANALLDAAGFEINGTTGWRDAPNGLPLEITIECPAVADGGLTSGSTWTAELALQAVHINATYQLAD